MTMQNHAQTYDIRELDNESQVESFHKAAMPMYAGLAALVAYAISLAFAIVF